MMGVAAQSTSPTDVLSWAQVLVGAPVAVTVIVMAFGAMYLLLKGHVVLGRELRNALESGAQKDVEIDELRSQLTAYRDKVEAEVLPTLVRTTDLVARLAYREEAR